MDSPKVIFIIIRENSHNSSIYYHVSLEGGSILRYMTDQEIDDKFLFFTLHLNQECQECKSLHVIKFYRKVAFKKILSIKRLLILPAHTLITCFF